MINSVYKDWPALAKEKNGERTMAILATGGAGYIGSHTCVALLEAGYDVVVVDNLVNSDELALQRVEEITSRGVAFYPINILDAAGLRKVFSAHKIEAVIHFAGLKAVGESVEKPWLYYQNNISGSLILVDVMAEFGVKKMVFSSSCTVYGEPEEIPISETAELQTPTNPYGMTKSVIERILQDMHQADPSWDIALLRYFNPVGAHASGLIGESPRGIPNNLLPYISQVAVGKLAQLSVFGDDYDTPDGTGVRDYIHVVDLADGHIKALEKLMEDPGVVIYNLGTGRGYSVLEMIDAFEEMSGIDIPYQVVARRSGDVGAVYADPSKAQQELGWKAERTLADMCADAWRWQSKNPQGYDD